jgi:hypothetical protein
MNAAITREFPKIVAMIIITVNMDEPIWNCLENDFGGNMLELFMLM